MIETVPGVGLQHQVSEVWDEEEDEETEGCGHNPLRAWAQPIGVQWQFKYNLGH